MIPHSLLFVRSINCYQMRAQLSQTAFGVVDDEGEDYLYPAEYFVFLNLPRKLERALSDAA